MNFMAISSDFWVDWGWVLLVVLIDAAIFGMIDSVRLRVLVGMVGFFLYVFLELMS